MGITKLALFIIIISTKNVFAFSTTNVLLRANIKNIVISSPLDGKLEELIHEQLRYLTGSFLEYDAGFSVGDIELKLQKQVQMRNMLETTFNATFDLLWPKEKKIPSSIKVILPNNGDIRSLSLFLKKYEKDCSYKINGQLGSFWSYIRPNKENCKLYSESGTNKLSSIYKVDLTRVTQPNFPLNLGNDLFKDKLFKATIVLGRVKKNYTNGPSFKDYKKLKSFLIEKHKNIIYSMQKTLGAKNEILLDTLVFEKKDIKYEYNFYIVNDFGQEVIAHVNKTINDVDFFSYNGHAGMGINITSIGKNSKFDLYRSNVLFLNSCITYGYFTYGDFSHLKGSSVILNSIQNHFGTFYESNRVIIEGLLNPAITYKSIIQQLPLKQRSLVLEI